MTDHDAGDNDSGLHSRINSSHSSGVDSASEAVGAYRRSEYPSMVTTESYPMHTGIWGILEHGRNCLRCLK